MAALVGMAFLLGYAIAQFGFYPPVLIFIAAALILAGMVATGWRWAPLLGVLVYGGLLVLAGPFIPYALAHPEESFMFSFMLVLLALALVGIGAGIGATVQNYRYSADERRTPRWLPFALTALAALCLGAILVAAIPQPGASAGISAEVLAGLPVLATENFSFDQTVIRARAGETVALRLDNHDPTGHSFDIDELNVHAPMTPGKSGLALFKPTQAGTYTFYCGVPGHREGGMVGRLVVEP
jgi:uncharacterized cupredoxin-like copper-binding protein